MAKRKTNVQIVKQMMEYSDYGPMAQMFIMEAIGKYADMCAKAKPEEMESGLISGEAWQAVAKEIQSKLAEHYKS